ncbi:MAG TPA: fluoride efflux transporter CrcB [Planctomycetes bacterium]|nr:fluoride efflux transporter CrcB [Planctomycetota bacterium]
MEWLAVAVGGMLGALGRYAVSGWVHRLTDVSGFPLGTLVVNVVGCSVLGVLMQLVEEGRFASAPWRLFIAVGLLGSFTTFSTFGYETLELLRGGDGRWAALNLLGNLLLGVGALLVGRLVVRGLIP